MKQALHQQLATIGFPGFDSLVERNTRRPIAGLVCRRPALLMGLARSVFKAFAHTLQGKVVEVAHTMHTPQPARFSRI